MKKTIFFCIPLSFLAFTNCKGLGGAAGDSPKAFNEKWTPQYPSLVGYWNMDEVQTANNAPFYAQRGGSGNVVNPNGTGLSMVAGVVNSALYFDGFDDRIRIPYAAGVNAFQFSVAAWINPVQTTGAIRTIVASESSNPSRGYSVYIDPAGQLQASVGHGDNSWAVATADTITPNVWTHVVVTYDGTELCIYLDGELRFHISTGYEPNGDRPMYIGAGRTDLDPAAQNFFVGAIDEVGIWASALTSNDVASIFKTQLPPTQ